MSWRIIATDASQLDFEALSEGEQASLADDLFGWVDDGPPRTKRRELAGVELFEDEVPSGFLVAYFVDENEPHVAILRVRRRCARWVRTGALPVRGADTLHRGCLDRAWTERTLTGLSGSGPVVSFCA
ncbi:MAG TPA: hypothetical protein VF942_09715, partial [Acidimicrobiales bacterium]